MTSNCCRNQTLFVCKEATNRDTSLKKQLLLSTENKQKVKTEKNSNRGSFFEDQTTDFTIAEVNFPENILVYANQGSATPPPSDKQTLLSNKLFILCNNVAADTSYE